MDQVFYSQGSCHDYKDCYQKERISACIFHARAHIHIMKEIYGEEPKYMYTSNKHYLRLLEYLRLESKKLDLPVRTIEKALFKKNIDGSRKC